MSTVLPSDSLIKVIICASIDAAEAKYQFLTPEQWLRALLILPKVRRILRGLRLDLLSVKPALGRTPHFGIAFKSHRAGPASGRGFRQGVFR